MSIIVSQSQVDETVANDLSMKLGAEVILASQIKTLFRKIVKEEANNLRVFGSPVSLDRYYQQLEQTLHGHYISVMSQFTRDFISPYTLPENTQNIELYNQEIRNRILNYSINQSATNAAIINETNKKDLQKAIADAVALGAISELEGISGFDIADAFEAEYFQDLDGRIDLIAETETQNAAEESKLIAALALIGVTGAAASLIKKQWNTILDGRERPWHHEADGQTQELMIPFIVNGENMQRPGDRTHASASNYMRCRCTATYLIADSSFLRI